MVQESKSLQSDILVPDDVVVLLDNTVNTVARTIKSGDSLKTLNYRVLSLRPADLESPNRTREKIQKSITAIEAGRFDGMFAQAARLQHPGNGETAVHAATLRDQSLARLRILMSDQHALTTLLEVGKKAVTADRALGFHETYDNQIEKASAYLCDLRSPITSAMDRLFESERIPFLILDDSNSRAMHHIPGHDGYLLPTDAAYVYLPAELPDSDSKSDFQKPLAFGQILFDQLLSQRLGLMKDTEVQSLPGIDLQKVRYYLGRKRSDIERYNKASRKPQAYRHVSRRPEGISD